MNPTAGRWCPDCLQWLPVMISKVRQVGTYDVSQGLPYSPAGVHVESTGAFATYLLYSRSSLEV